MPIEGKKTAKETPAKRRCQSRSASPPSQASSFYQLKCDNGMSSI
jgi:hypothetical protein